MQDKASQSIARQMAQNSLIQDSLLRQRFSNQTSVHKSFIADILKELSEDIFHFQDTNSEKKDELINALMAASLDPISILEWIKFKANAI